jgi:hypothetical protein
MNTGVGVNIAQTRLSSQREVVNLLPGSIEIDSLRIRALDRTNWYGDITTEERYFTYDQIVALYPKRANGPNLFTLAIVDPESPRKIACLSRWIIHHCCRTAFLICLEQN